MRCNIDIAYCVFRTRVRVVDVEAEVGGGGGGGEVADPHGLT